MKEGKLLTGKKTVPERIRDNRQPYVDALKAADKAWDAGHLDFSVMANYLEGLMLGQLTDI
jgi:hypothetical protein